MNNSIISRKWVGVFLAVGFLAVIVAVIGGVVGRGKVQDKPQDNQTMLQASTIRKAVDENSLPDKFPADFPRESGAKILQNDVQTSADGKFQATRSYETAKTLADNFQIFQTYFQKTGWKVTDSVNALNFKSITAVKGDLSLKVSLNNNELTKTQTVDLYLIQVTPTP
jgi:hypothetical protein